MYQIKFTNQFKKDLKRARKRGLDLAKLEAVIETLSVGQELDIARRDHALTGNWVGHRECHVAPDWLLVYYKDNEVLVLTLVTTGSHADLF